MHSAFLATSIMVKFNGFWVERKLYFIIIKDRVGNKISWRLNKFRKINVWWVMGAFTNTNFVENQINNFISYK